MPAVHCCSLLDVSRLVLLSPAVSVGVDNAACPACNMPVMTTGRFGRAIVGVTEVIAMVGTLDAVEFVAVADV